MSAAIVAPFVVIAATVVGLNQSYGQPIPLSTSVLKQRLAESQARVWAWEIEYESAREESPGVPAKSYVHRVVAAKAPDRFFHWSAHGTPSLDWRDDPFQQRLTVTADQMVVERPLDRFFNQQRIQPDEPLPGSAPHELLLTALGWWPLDRRPTPTVVDKLPAAMAVVARTAEYQVRPRLEQVGGRWCHLLEYPGRDQLWLDVGRGCAVVVRQISYPALARTHRVEFADFRELLPGVWAPFSLRNIHYERAPDGSLGQVVLDATLTVRRIRLNAEVDDSRFRFKPLPGSAGTINNQRMRQVSPGGEDYLDEVVDWIRRYTRRSVPPMGRIGWGDIGLGALLGGSVVGTLLWRRCRAPYRGGEP